MGDLVEGVGALLRGHGGEARCVALMRRPGEAGCVGPMRRPGEAGCVGPEKDEARAASECSASGAAG